jgi:hypothetical protein
MNNITPRMQVIDLTTGSLAVVVSTHTYPDGTQIASIKSDKRNEWVVTSELQVVSK